MKKYYIIKTLSPNPSNEIYWGKFKGIYRFSTIYYALMFRTHEDAEAYLMTHFIGDTATHFTIEQNYTGQHITYYKQYKNQT